MHTGDLTGAISSTKSGFRYVLLHQILYGDYYAGTKTNDQYLR